MNIPYLPLQQLNNRFYDLDQHAFKTVHQTGHYIGGQIVDVFERDFAQYCGVSNVVSTGNGLDALTLILLADRANGILPNHARILLPAHTFIATYLSIINAGMQPVPVDVNNTLLSVFDIQPHISTVDAIITVDLYGKLVSDDVYQYANDHNKPIYCDAAQSHGAVNSQGYKSGSIARASAFSFYPTKNLGALGDGGALTTNDNTLAQTARMIANYGKYSRYTYIHKGINSRLDTLQAALLSNRLTQLDQDNNHRKHIAQSYYNYITNPEVQLLDKHFLLNNVFHVFPVFVNNRSHFIEYLNNCGIGTNIHYPIPPHAQQALSEFNHLTFNQTEYLHQTQVSLPCHPILHETSIQYIIKCINAYKK